jgi:hypothetical protein
MKIRQKRMILLLGASLIPAATQLWLTLEALREVFLESSQHYRMGAGCRRRVTPVTLQ